MLQRFIAPLFLFLISAPGYAAQTCATSALSEPNFNLIKEFSNKLANEVIPCKTSHLTAKFKKDGKELYFTGVTHGRGPESENKNFQNIRRAFNELKPDSVVVEGIAANEGESPAERVKAAQACAENNFVNCPEIQFAAHLAIQAKKAFQGAEPAPQDIIEFLKPEYTKNDYACFMWLSMVAGSRKAAFREENNPHLETNLENTRKSIQAIAGVSMSYNDFIKCYESKTGTKFDLNRVSSRDYQPNKNSPHFFQNFMYKMEQARNPQILRTLRRRFDKDNKVLIVYGGGHFVETYEALVETYGKPRIQCHD